MHSRTGHLAVSPNCKVIDPRVAAKADRDRVEGLKPITWMHIEKTGQSFMYTVLQYACPGVNTSEVDRRVKVYSEGKQDASVVVFAERQLKMCYSKPLRINACPPLGFPLCGKLPQWSLGGRPSIASTPRRNHPYRMPSTHTLSHSLTRPPTHRRAHSSETSPLWQCGEYVSGPDATLAIVRGHAQELPRPIQCV